VAAGPHCREGYERNSADSAEDTAHKSEAISGCAGWTPAPQRTITA
jgi:hypothetical protein